MKKESIKEQKIKVTKNGPYLVSGSIPLIQSVIIADKEGTPEKWKEEKKFKNEENYALCRCGKSKNKPFCDGSHIKNNFDGTETFDVNEKFLDNVELTEGPELILQDNSQFCSGAGFCHGKSGTWDLTEKSNLSECKKLVIEQCMNCPSGRLVPIDKKTKKPIETVFSPSICITEHPKNIIGGPIWVRGNILIESAEGKQYEKRNRVTLCRCGKSKNKPFCEGSHID